MIMNPVFAALTIFFSLSSGITTQPQPECPPPDYEGPTVYFADYHDCHFYYECVHGDKIHTECPPNQFFDMFKFFCGDLSEVTCGGKYPSTSSIPTVPTKHTDTPTPPTRPSTPPTPPTKPPTPPTPPTKPTSPTTPPTPPSSPTPPTAPTKPTSKPTPAPGMRCIGVIDGEYLPYPEDCSRYIECVGEKEYYFHCPRDLYYNKSTAKCDSASKDSCI